jgi:hypothetical protein
MNGILKKDHPLTGQTKSGIQDYDISMIKTEYDIVYQAGISPICLPTGKPDIEKVKIIG